MQLLISPYSTPSSPSSYNLYLISPPVVLDVSTSTLYSMCMELERLCKCRRMHIWKTWTSVEICIWSLLCSNSHIEEVHYMLALCTSFNWLLLSNQDKILTPALNSDLLHTNSCGLAPLCWITVLSFRFSCGSVILCTCLFEERK